MHYVQIFNFMEKIFLLPSSQNWQPQATEQMFMLMNEENGSREK